MDYAGLLKTFVDVTGPHGAIIAGVIVGLAGAIIVYAKSADLFAGAREQGSKGDLLTHFGEEVERLAGAEQNLRRDLSRAEAKWERLADKNRELQSQVALMRAALRRAIDILRAVKEGRIAPAAIEAIDTIDTGL